MNRRESLRIIGGFLGLVSVAPSCAVRTIIPPLEIDPSKDPLGYLQDKWGIKSDSISYIPGGDHTEREIFEAVVREHYTSRGIKGLKLKSMRIFKRGEGNSFYCARRELGSLRDKPCLIIDYGLDNFVEITTTGFKPHLPDFAIRHEVLEVGGEERTYLDLGSFTRRWKAVSFGSYIPKSFFRAF